jgi:dCTP deaminase
MKGLLNDLQIKEYGDNMISPFFPESITENNGIPCLSYGLSSFGYDIRLSPHNFKLFQNDNNNIIDVKNFNQTHLKDIVSNVGAWGEYFVIPPHTYGLGVSLEKVTMPNDITAIAIGKSSYARCGLIANITPIEAGWTGYITLEFSNSSDCPVKLYANEGVVQLLFFKGKVPEKDYTEKGGRYNNQPHRIVYSQV